MKSNLREGAQANSTFFKCVLIKKNKKDQQVHFETSFRKEQANQVKSKRQKVWDVDAVFEDKDSTETVFKAVI